MLESMGMECSFLLQIGSASRNEDAWKQCEARLDGELPYYVPSNFRFSGNVRRYYVAAEVVPWDYAPTGRCFRKITELFF
ncbi:hypothetical protein N7510_001345 [Penicillium lagena]|uniref:uncharacterized protein n=1 Tax=Penicillium lagena TaxID=94218 RepID=UPI00254041AF|nr:uncharacterized protein N7510_001345 [Penicillium lagena]KAJ5625036.1 hypothetical protein N7510_001345 [Penicillium lagena]